MSATLRIPPTPPSTPAPSPAPGVGAGGPAPTAAPAEPAITARGFGLSYGPRRALRAVSLEIPRQAVTAVMGPSGCGKSTLLRSINRLNDLVRGVRYEGDIRVGADSVFAPGTDVVALRSRVGMVFQRPNPFPRSVFDNVAYGPALSGLVARRELPDVVESCLRRAALWDEVKDRLEAPATSLSGGQQQRLCIARALANRPEVLLLDEPCSALDPIATARVEELLVELKRDYTVVIVTHNLQQAARVSDYAAFLEAGALVEYGETARVFTAPANPRTEAYLTGRFG